MDRSNRELWHSFLTIILISLLYLFVVMSTREIPRASDLFGHTLGVAGFILMLMTEILYSWRKRQRSRSARLGKMVSWLRFHIFTGIVGPFMVLLHTSWKFNGLAGVLLLLTIVVVVSGFIGRYIYTAIPRTSDGVALEAFEMEREIAAVEAELTRWQAEHPESARFVGARLSVMPKAPGGQVGLVLGRGWADWAARLRWRRVLLHERWGVNREIREQMRQLDQLIKRQQALRRELASLAMARRLLALWHVVHIPLGMALFAAAFIHIVAAIYYATLLN